MNRRRFLAAAGGSFAVLSGCLGDGDGDDETTPTATPVGTSTPTSPSGQTPTPTGTPSDNQTPAGGTPENAVEAGTRLFDAIRTGSYQEGYTLFLSQIQNRVSPGQLEALWIGLTNVGGSFEEVVEQTEVTQSGFEGVEFTLAFARSTHNFRVLTDPNRDYAIVGAFVNDEYSSPDYVDSAAFETQETTVDAEDCKMEATLTLPTGTDSAPGVVLVHGSDPTGNATKNLKTGGSQPFRDLAEGLASNGVAVLRYDRRTNACPDTLSPSSHTIDRVAVDDALTAIEQLRTAAGVDGDRIVATGLELGGMVTPRIAERDGNLAGIVPMAPPARPLYELLVEQFEYLSSVGDAEWTRMNQITKQWNERIESLRNGDYSADQVILGYPGALFQSIEEYDHIGTAQALDVPMFFVQGQRDYQVSPEADFGTWESELGGSAVTFQRYDGRNHLFQPGDGPSVPQEYSLSNPVDAAVVSDIADWVSQR